jgi:hypothetical protein
MSQICTKDLARRIQTLECRVRQSTPSKRNLLVDLAIRAMVSAWTRDEIEKVLAAAECQELDDLPAELRRRWVEDLDRIALANFGRTFAALLAVSPERQQPDLGPPARSPKRRNVDAGN